MNAIFFISLQSIILRIKLDNDYKVLSILYILSKLLRQSVSCPLSMWEEYSMVARMALLGVLVRSELVMSFKFLIPRPVIPLQHEIYVTFCSSGMAPSK